MAKSPMTRTRGSSDCKSPAWRAICSDAMARASARVKPIIVEARNPPRSIRNAPLPVVAEPNAASPGKPAAKCRPRTLRKENSRSARSLRRSAHRPETARSRAWRAAAFRQEAPTARRNCSLRRQLVPLLCRIASSEGDHSPQAFPAARIPSGVSTISRATAIHSLRSEFVAAGAIADAASVAGSTPAVLRKRAGSAACK